MSTHEFHEWFQQTTKLKSPRPWQQRLASENTCQNQVIRIPTGQGKTLGVLASWVWHRCILQDESWPRRLIWCLPMRVLTEQTVAEAQGFLDQSGLSEEVKVHTLMGGVDSGDWHLYPERPAIIVGTQDMLLSRALNRGYATARARWPMEFGMLSQDALWVYDEIQLMDVGLATAAQLQAYRDDDHEKHLRPVYSWWMSATLQNEWLKTVDTENHHDTWTADRIEVLPDERNNGPCAVSKTLSTTVITGKDHKQFAQAVLDAHQDGSITLVVCNTVDRASACYAALVKAGRNPAENIELVHSRFRPMDRVNWRERFLNRSACGSGVDRIIVATQVVEAGVDISAQTLITELAPWPSLVQRFGRCARYDGAGAVLVVDRGHDDKTAKPYSAEELSAALKALEQLSDVGIASLEEFEAQLSTEDRAALYPYEPAHLLLRRDYDDLFDTTPDLTGADLDIARFIRTGEERDVQVCWHEWEKGQAPADDFHPHRDTLCAVPIYKANDWLKKNKETLRPYQFDYVDARWTRINQPDQLRPGTLIVVDTTGGGYDTKVGFTGAKPGKKDLPIPMLSDVNDLEIEDLADAGQDREDLSHCQEQTISEHCYEVATAAKSLAQDCAPSLTHILHLAARLHDWGKAHPAFQNSIIDNNPHGMLAKAPQERWRRGRQLYPMDKAPSRPGFRHELASALAVFELLAQHQQKHPALLGNLQEVIECGALTVDQIESIDGGPLAIELAALSAPEVDLLCHLIASHHGKLRASWHACPQDQDYPTGTDSDAELPLRGVRQGDRLPAVTLPGPQGEAQQVPALTMHLAPAAMGLNGRYGISWRERTLALQQAHGPAALAYLEALLRAADIRISKGDRDLLGDNA